MGQSVLSDQNYAYSEQGYLVDNLPWQDEIKKRLETVLAPRVTDPMPTLNPQEFEPLLLPENPEASTEEKAAEPTAEEVAERLRGEAEEKAKGIEQAARKNAFEIVEQARWEGNDLIAKAKEEAEKEIQQLKETASEEGRKQGLARGLEEGFERGRIEGQANHAGAIQKWNKVLEETLAQRQKLLSEMQPLLVELVGDVLHQCLKRKADGDRQMVVEFAEEALKKAQDRVHLKLHLNPADVDEVRAQGEKLRLSVGAGALEMIPDGRIEQGGCLLETEAGSVDVRLSTVVSQAKEALSQGKSEV
jgi:flagellar biosynthesis/type III secretory pathway protein FliH